jgi:hypothetical protein
MATSREEATERGKKKADSKAQERQSKSEKGKKGKGKGKDDGASAGRPSVANHPRAAASVRRMKGLAGLIGFGLAALLAHRAGLSPTRVLERALLIGIGSYLLAWACAVAVWRQLVMAELRVIFDVHQEHVRSLSEGSHAGEPAKNAAPTSGSATSGS